MREPFEALLEKVLKRLDGTSRQMSAARLARDSGTAVTLLNEFYFDVPAEERAAILARNAEGDHAPDTTVEGADEVRLIAAARYTRGRDFAAAFASFLGVPVSTAERILEDASGNALTVACKGANVRRATYSALALLTVCELRINPGRRADRFVEHWQKLDQASLRQYQAGDFSGYNATRSAMGDMARGLERDPQLESILANRKRDLGIAFESGRRLGQELAFTHGIDLGRGRGIGI